MTMTIPVKARILIHHTYDVFVRMDGNEIAETKLVKRSRSDRRCLIVQYAGDSVECWQHPTDERFIYAGTIRAPLRWLIEDDDND